MKNIKKNGKKAILDEMVKSKKFIQCMQACMAIAMMEGSKKAFSVIDKQIKDHFEFTPVQYAYFKKVMKSELA